MNNAITAMFLSSTPAPASNLANIKFVGGCGGAGGGGGGLRGQLGLRGQFGLDLHTWVSVLMAELPLVGGFGQRWLCCAFS